jgi:hypothetical protein
VSPEQRPARKNYETNPIPFSDTQEAREWNLRNEPNFEPNPNKMKPIAPFAKRTQFFALAPGPQFPAPHIKLIAIAMPASQPL